MSPGESLTVTEGANTFTLDFGYGATQISTLAELNTAIAGYPAAMGSASFVCRSPTQTCGPSPSTVK